jgi:phytoene/squalene synthetase
MKRKTYAPVTDFERATSYCPRKAAPRCRPLYLAWRILDEARDRFRTPIPEAFADKLAYRAEAVFVGIAFENAFSGCVNRL